MQALLLLVLLFLYSLSVGIGGASALFVGTDVSFAANPVAGLFGVYPATAMSAGMTKAGLSTAVGFFGVQTVQNSVGSQFVKKE